MSNVWDRHVYGQPPAYGQDAPPMGTPVKINRKPKQDRKVEDPDVVYNHKRVKPTPVKNTCRGVEWHSSKGVAIDLCKGTVNGKFLFDEDGNSKVLKLSDLLFPASIEENIWETEGKNAYEKLCNFLSPDSDLGISRRKQLLEAEWILTCRDEVVAAANRALKEGEQDKRKPEDLPVMNLWILSFILHHADAKKSVKVLNWPEYRKVERQFVEGRLYSARVGFIDVAELRKNVAVEIAPCLARDSLMFKSPAEAKWMNPRTLVMMCRGGAISEEEREAASVFGELVIDVRLHKGKYQHLKVDKRTGKMIEDSNERYHHRMTDEEFDMSAAHMVNQFADAARFIKENFDDTAPFTIEKAVLSMDEHSGQAIFAAATYAGLGIASRVTVLQYHDGHFTEFPVLIE
eukprot:TRINITY_DN741_c0_g1_i4.p1 TRINITY_DN741_c0_g1~~TRINITY_DN741_c0_g1_i4.p1  ORF type:complete len:414 (+),score=124.40 TRINITY_DN741_c0_g1_i4:36-1244(+)